MRQRAVILMSLWLFGPAATGPAAAAAQVAPAPAEEASPAPAEGAGLATVEQDPADAWVLTLDECIEAALANNLDIAVSRFDPRRSETRVTFQESAFDPFLFGSAITLQDQNRSNAVIAGSGGVAEFEFPSEFERWSWGLGIAQALTLGGSYRVDLNARNDDRLNTNFDFTTFSTFPTATEEYNTSWKITFTQPLLRNLGPQANKTRIVVAANNLGVSESQFRQTLLDGVAAAEQAYWELNFTLMELRTVHASLEQAKDFLGQNRIKVRVGTLAPIEITQAEADVAEREQNLIVAEFAVLAAEDELRRVMGVAWDSPEWKRPIRPSEEPPQIAVAPDLEEMQRLAAENRPDVEQAFLEIRSREAELYYSENQRRWGLDFQGIYGTEGVSGILMNQGYGGAFDDMTDRNQVDWNLSLNLTVPLRNREAIANYTDASYALEQSRVSLQRIAQSALVEVRNAVRRVATDLKRVNAAKVNTRLQREKLEAEEKKFENGMSTSFEVLTFQTDLARAETLQNRAIVDYNKSQAELGRVTGTLLASRGIAVPSGEDAAPHSAALRSLWRRDGSASLRLADTTDYTVALPARFGLASGRVVPLEPSR
jgi:outer membrane protein TolC